jgi:hypothetical protein
MQATSLVQFIYCRYKSTVAATNVLLGCEEYGVLSNLINCKDNRITDITLHETTWNVHHLEKYVPNTSHRSVPPTPPPLPFHHQHHHHHHLLLFLNYGLAFSSANLTSFRAVLTPSSFKTVISHCSCNSIGYHYCMQDNVRILLSHVHNIWDGAVMMKETDLETLMDFIFSPPEYEKLFSGIPFVCVWALLTPERFDRVYSHSVFKNVVIIGPSPVKMKILAPKEEPFTWTPKNKIVIFWNGSYNWLKFGN